MAMDFPPSPIQGQVYSNGSVSYTYNGYAWVGGTPGSATFAPLLSPVFTGDPRAPTPTQGDNDTSIATTEFVTANAVKKSGDTMTGALNVNNWLTVKGGAAGGYGRIVIDDDGGAFNSALVFQHGGEEGWNLNNNPGAVLDFQPPGAAAATAKVSINATTPSTSPTTGALTVASGVGIAGVLNVGLAVGVGADGNTLPGANNTAPGFTVNGAGYACLSRGSGGTALHVNTNTDGPLCTWFRSGVTVGNITVFSNSTVYNTVSSAELKEDLRSFDAGRIIDDTEVYDFKWKDIDARSYGVLAQQAVEVYPQAITHDEKEDWWGVDYSKYVPVLLQELKALRTRVAELEGKISVDPKSLDARLEVLEQALARAQSR